MFFNAFLNDGFLQMACFASLLASVASGVIGSFVVIKRISFIAGSISHSVIAGIGFCIWLNKKMGISFPDPLTGAFLAAIASSLLIGWIHLKYKEKEDAVIAAVWSTGMAIGIIFLSISPGSNNELMNILFGNILWTSQKDLILLGVLDVILVGTIFLNFRRLLSLCFDEEHAILRGIPTTKLYLMLLCLIGISVVLLIQVIGAILVLALLIIPPTIAALFTSRLSYMIFLGFGICACLSFLGLFASFHLDFPPGATIALLAATCYFLLLPLKRKKNLFRRKKASKEVY